MLATRRAFVGTLAAAPLGLISRLPAAATAATAAALTDLRIDAATLRARLEKLSEFGRPDGGAFADGVSRVAYSEADIAGRTYVIGLMRAAGLEPRIDPEVRRSSRDLGDQPERRRGEGADECASSSQHDAALLHRGCSQFTLMKR